MHQSHQASAERLPAARYRAPGVSHQFAPGELVTWNGHKGKVSGHTKAGLAVVTFGHGRRKELAESELDAFVAWWSERD